MPWMTAARPGSARVERTLRRAGMVVSFVPRMKAVAAQTMPVCDGVVLVVFPWASDTE